MAALGRLLNHTEPSVRRAAADAMIQEACLEEEESGIPEEPPSKKARITHHHNHLHDEGEVN